MLEFLRTQFDKLLLLFMVIYFTIFMMILLIRYPNLDAGTLQWIEKSVDLVTGAIIGTVTGAAIALARNVAPPPPPPAPPPLPPH